MSRFVFTSELMAIMNPSSQDGDYGMPHKIRSSKSLIKRISFVVFDPPKNDFVQSIIVDDNYDGHFVNDLATLFSKN